jgi:hypothetical protein
VVLIESQWQKAGIAEVKDVEMTFGQSATTIGIGNYDAVSWQPNVTCTLPDLGVFVRNKWYSPPDGIKAAPTLNLSWANDAQLSALAEKQLGVFDKNERIKVFHDMEDLHAEQQYSIASVTTMITYFGDPSVKNMQTPRDAYNGAIPYVKYWWFDKA